MSQDRGNLGDENKLPDRGKPPEDSQSRNAKPSQINPSYDLFGNQIMPAAADSTRVPGGDRDHLNVEDKKPAAQTSSPQSPPKAPQTPGKIPKSVIIIASIGMAAFAAFIVIKFIVPSRMSASEIFKTCGPSIVTLKISTRAKQVDAGKYDIVSFTDPDEPILAIEDDDGDPHLYQKGKVVSTAVGILSTPKSKLPVAVRLSGSTPIIYLLEKGGKATKLPLSAQLSGYGSGSIGSGFFVRPDVVATNCHVVSTTDIGVAGFAGGTAQITDQPAQFTITGKPIAYDKEHDLALLFIPGTQAKPLVLHSNYSDLRAGESVYALGTPKGWAGTITEGLISSDKLRSSNEKSDPDAPKFYLQHSCKIDHGNSGGPLVNGKGEVIGVNTLGIGNGTVNFAVIPKLIDELLNKPETKARIEELSKKTQTDLHG